MTSEVDRDVKVYHATQKGKPWHAFVVTDISDLCADTDSLKRDLSKLLKVRKHGPVEEYKGAIFIRGDYDSETMDLIQQTFQKYMPADRYQIHKGDYFEFLSRYHFWNLIDTQVGADSK